MKTSEFDYELPRELIAQHPAARRESSRLLCLERVPPSISHHRFADVPYLLRPGDRLVLNDTRVIPARLLCRKPTGARVELVFERRVDAHRWSAIGRPGKHLKPGTRLVAGERGNILLSVEKVLAEQGRRLVALVEGASSMDEVIETSGVMPLPPYIEHSATDEDRERYQTVYARVPGAIAAPTAGLHFTDQLLDRLRETGIGVSHITLHVGIGTFRPVSEDDPTKHAIHHEQYVLTRQTVEEIGRTRESGGRIVAVGTTVVRVLEHCWDRTAGLKPSTGSTGLFILPGYRFRAVDALITNFHLPRSTLLMLVSAFAGRESTLRAYREAVEQRYRFYSYGDAMLIV